MYKQGKLYNPSLYGDNRQSLPTINPWLQKSAEQITTLKFQIAFIVIMASVDLIFTRLIGVSGKIFEFIALYAVEACFFFAYIYIIFPKLTSVHSKFIVVASVVFASLCVFIICYYAVYAIFTPDPIVFIESISWKHIAGAVYRGWHRIVFSFFLWLAYVIKYSAKREQVLENNILFSRISPHLLFNALNMLPTETTGPVKNEKIIELLSRYTSNAMIELGSDGKGFLSVELDQLETLIQINELRFHNVYIQWKKELPNNIEDFRIPPQIIVTLAENIFKYGIVNDPHTPAMISIREQNQYLTVRMENRKYPVPEHASSNIGLSSVQKRLSNIYGKNHHFHIHQTEETFSISIGFPV